MTKILKSYVSAVGFNNSWYREKRTCSEFISYLVCCPMILECVLFLYKLKLISNGWFYPYDSHAYYSSHNVWADNSIFFSAIHTVGLPITAGAHRENFFYNMLGTWFIPSLISWRMISRIIFSTVFCGGRWGVTPCHLMVNMFSSVPVYHRYWCCQFGKYLVWQGSYRLVQAIEGRFR